MRPGVFLIRFLAGMAIGVAAVTLVLVGVAAQLQKPARAGGVLAAGQRSGGWANADELRWLHKVGVWNVTLMRGLSTASTLAVSHRVADGKLPGGRSAEVLIRSLAPARSCATALRTRVGVPPTQRLQKPWRTLQTACAYLRRFGTELTQAVMRRSYDRVPPAEGVAQTGAQLLLRADQMLPPGETRPLPVIGGTTTISRIEPRFSRIAGALAGHHVEVRCWSVPDWTHLMREEGAYTLNHLDGALGFAAVYGTRENLSPATCASLVQLAYRHRYPMNGEQQLSAAQAVATLSHEPQHSKGGAVEAQAECYAIQLMKGTAMRLGAPRGYAAGLQQLFWSRYDEELPSYRSPECRNGGAYDLRKSDPNFP